MVSKVPTAVTDIITKCGYAIQYGETKTNDVPSRIKKCSPTALMVMRWREKEMSRIKMMINKHVRI